MAFFTLVLAVVAILQWLTYRDTLAANKAADRAYVKMAHAPKPSKDPNGGRFHFVTPIGGTRTEVWFKYGVKNCGRTPCNVLGGGIWYVTDTQDERPPSSAIPAQVSIRVDPTFLVPGMATTDQTALFIDSTTIDRVRSGDEHLWLLGFVDYSDRFGDYHRAGYGRHYDPNTLDLVFDKTTAPFNDDRRLTENEAKQYRES